jgi:hypothetical protein
MLKSKWRIFRLMFIPVLILVFSIPPGFSAPDHLVSPARLRQEAAAATAARERNIRTVSEFLSLPMAKKALGMAHVDLIKVKNAVSTMTDEEVAQLALRAEKSQKDFAAGNMTERDLLLLILGVSVLVLVIVAVR